MVSHLLSSSIGKKAVMAVTGILLAGFVIMHLAGNLLIFLGPQALNAYANKLQELGPLLWAARILLLGAAILHIVCAVTLALENKKARPIGYERKKDIQTTLAAKTMVFSGLMILAFVVYHLLHFTFRVTHREISNFKDALGHPDVYSMVVLSFKEPLISGFYLLAMSLLFLHLAHGIASSFQSLGLSDEKIMTKIQGVSRTLSFLVFLGYISIPLAVLFKVIRIAPGVGV